MTGMVFSPYRARPQGAASRPRLRRRGDRMIDRRRLVALFGGATLAWPLELRAQQPGRSYRLGSLTNQPRDPPNPERAAILEGLGQHGFAEGQNLTFDPADTDCASTSSRKPPSSWPRPGRCHRGIQRKFCNSRRPAGDGDDPDPRNDRRHGRLRTGELDGRPRRQHDRAQPPRCRARRQPPGISDRADPGCAPYYCRLGGRQPNTAPATPGISGRGACAWRRAVGLTDRQARRGRQRH
jgi:hypothetical protein